MKKTKYNLGGLTALKDKIDGANPFPDLTKKERDVVMEAYTDGAIKEKGGKINPQNFDGYIITRFEAPSKYNFAEYRNEVFKGTYTRFYGKRSGKKELKALLDGYSDFKLESDNVDNYGGWWLFEKYNNPHNKSIVIVETSSIMGKGGKLEAKGDCYYASGTLIMRDFLNKIDYQGTPYLVHAEVQGQGKIEDIRYGHSWIEDDEMVYDYSNGRKLHIPKPLYYKMGDVKTDNPKKYQKYTFDEARMKMVDSGHYGCWDLETDYAKGGALFMPSGRELLYQDENVALQHNKISDHYSLLDAKTGMYLAKGGKIVTANVKFFDKDGKIKQELEKIEKITFGKDPFADKRVREKTLDEIREEMLRSDSQITRELAYETAPFVYGLQGLNDEEVARYMGYEDVAEQKREEQKQDAEWEETQKNFKEHFYKEYNGMQVDSVEFAGVVDIDGKNKTIKRIYDEKVFRPSKAKLKALEKEIFEDYEKGGVLKTEIDENGSNIPKQLQEVFDQFDEDADAYVEAERLRMKANEIGYDFDYGLSGEPTDFWKMSDNYAKGGEIKKEKVKKSHYKIYDKKSNKFLGEVEKGSGGIWYSYDEFGTPISNIDTELWMAITPFQIRANEGNKSYLEYVTTTNSRYKLYAKGGALSNEFKFDVNFIVYVPSTTDVGEHISKEELEKRVQQVKDYVANEFGGYTETETDGGYKATDGTIVEEDIVKVSVFAKQEDWDANEEKIVAQIRKWGKQWEQEAIGFEFEGDLYYVDEEKKFKGGGNTRAFYKYNNGGVIITYDNGGVIQDTCYVNYVGYEIQNKRCKREGIDFFMLGEYRDVARNLRETYTSEWIYYNRMARLFISPKQAKEFVKQANKYFKPIVEVNGYFVEVDRSFATYKVATSKPINPQELNTNIGRSETREPTLDKIADKRRVEMQNKKAERQEKADKPIAYPSQWREVNGRYWWIGLMVNIGGQGDYGDSQWKNTKLNEHIPQNDGVSLMTLIHEYAHCLDFNTSIEEEKVYERPYGEMRQLSKTDFFGNKIPKQELQQIVAMQKAGVKDITLLSNHENEFIKALSKILRGGMSNGIPLLNEIENEAYEIEKKVGGKNYADQKRKEAKDKFLMAMQKSVDKANIPHLNVQIPMEIKDYISRTSNAYILQIPQKEFDKEVGMKLLPTLDLYKEQLKDNLYINPTRNNKLLGDVRKIVKDINRLIERT
jgi:hypothetical protein